jgi:heterotetrameric sarcosine oxidase gamma subunit
MQKGSANVAETTVAALPAETLTAILSPLRPAAFHLALEPDMSLVLGPATPPPGGYAIDVSHSYAAFAVEGPGAAELLAQGIALDFERLPADFAGRTRLGEITVILQRRNGGYVLRCERSYREWLAGWLAEAMRVRLLSAGI